MSIINSQPLIGASGQGGGYNLTNSLRFRSSASAYLNRTPASAGNSKTFTISLWVKRGNLGAGGVTNTFISARTDDNNRDSFSFGAEYLEIFNVVGGGINTQLTTSSFYRDPSAWYHIVMSVDTTQATASNRFKIYVNGVQVTSFTTATYPSLNTDFSLNKAIATAIGRYQYSSPAGYLDGYLTEFNLIDGQALTPTSFGSFNALTGVWQPARYTGTYGTNGFYLPFTDNSALTTSSNVGLGKDFSGNGNYWTTNNISITAGATYDSMTDVPTLTSATTANYCVLNPLSLGSSVTLSNGNLTMAEGGSYATTVSTMAMTSGKWYAEMTVGSDTYAGTVGIAKLGYSPTSRLGFQANTWSYNNDGGLYYNSSTLAVVSSYTTGDVIGIAFDATNLTIAFYKNNTLQSTQYTSANSGLTAGEFYFANGHINSTSNWNFGQRPFAYTPPTGFVALNTFNLPNSTIVAGNKQMDATIYTGTGSAQSIVNSGGFQPDFVWAKSRSNTNFHNLMDSVRGTNKLVYSNSTAAEETNAQIFTALNSNGFSVGTDNSANQSGQTFVAWQWKAGGTAVTNTAGTISAQVSANTTSGFSVVTYTGTGSASTIGHGLGVAPAMVMVKSRSNNTGDGFVVYHKSLPSASYWLDLATTGAQSGPNSVVWNGTAPTSSVFSVGSASGTNTNTYTYVAYCFSEISGYSKFGSYTGNGSSDGPFVFTGFRPRFIMFKGTTLASSWLIYDTARSAINPVPVTGGFLLANSSAAEAGTGDSAAYVDILSNGFKIRNNSGFDNNSGSDTYIYMAFAENPFKNSLAR